MWGCENRIYRTNHHDRIEPCAPNAVDFNWAMQTDLNSHTITITIIISRDVFQHLSTSWTTHLNDPTDPHDKARGRTVVPVVLFMLRFIAKPRTFCPKTAGAKQCWQKHCQCGRWKKMVKLSITTLQGTNMPHVGEKNSDSIVIFDGRFSGIC